MFIVLVILISLFIISGSFICSCTFKLPSEVISLVQYNYVLTHLLCAVTGKHISICFRPNSTLCTYYFIQLIFKSIKRKIKNIHLYCLL